MDRRLFQNAWFVADLPSAIAKWETMFGAGPFTVAAHHKTDRFSYRGTGVEADVSYAFGYLGDLMIQLIEQHDEKASIYRDMFAGGEEGFHHIAYLVDDFEAEYARLESLGYAPATRLYADGVDAAYFNARRSRLLHRNPRQPAAHPGEFRRVEGGARSPRRRAGLTRVRTRYWSNRRR